MAARVGEDRIATIPNLLSLVRLLCVPLFLYLLFVHHDRGFAAWLLGGLGATDWVDGYVARHFNQVSNVGKILDPVADRTLLLVGVTAIIIDGSVPWFIGVLALTREALIAGGTLYLAAKGAKRLDVQWAGKAGTFGLMFAFPFFMGSRSDLGNPFIWRTAAWACAIPGLVLGFYSLFIYVPMAKKALAERTLGTEALPSGGVA